MANITKIAILATSFVDGEVLSAQKLNGVISGINTVISKVNECIDEINGGTTPTPTPTPTPTVEYFNDDVLAGTPYHETLSECYIPYNYGNLCIKYYNGSLFVYSVIQGSEYKFTVRMGDSTYNFANSIIYPLIVKTAGMDANVPVGTVVGYLIFKDIDKFKGAALSKVRVNANENCKNIEYSPTISAAIQSGTIEAPYSDLV